MYSKLRNIEIRKTKQSKESYCESNGALQEKLNGKPSKLIIVMKILRGGKSMHCV